MVPAQLAKARGFVPILAPLQQMTPLNNAGDWMSAGALAFTSANGVRALFSGGEGDGQEEAQAQRFQGPVFCVGPATAAAARATGFQFVHEGDGGVDELAQTIFAFARQSPIKGEIYHFSGVVRAGDLSASLVGGGLPACNIAIYEMTPLADLPAAITDMLANQSAEPSRIWAAFFSGRSAALFLSLIDACGLEGEISSINAVCISDNVAQSIAERHWRSVAVASVPTAQGVINAIG